ncbi:helix-turn-helix domain-containing protein [Roseomonas elaeocarpi]|uniref:Helix-turn-helix domain-containing protein n=1 Tax=Roseomonas elaeocarpi TaxID=907779 RepID=A0ABV6JNC6_9PROT
MQTTTLTAPSDIVSGRRFIPARQMGGVAGLLDGRQHRPGHAAPILTPAQDWASAMVTTTLPRNTVPTPSRGGASLAPWQEKRVRAFVEEHLHESVSVTDMAAVAKLSRSFFSRAFGTNFGNSPHAFVMERRIARAKAMMLDTNEPLAEIAVACGLSDQAHLSRLFRRQVDCTPSAWRRHARAAGTAPQAMAA